MFDYIRSEVPLPDGFEGELQTKDFECELATHVIRADGRLILAVLDHTEAVPKEERRFPDDDGILGLAGSLRFIWRHEDANYHGIVNFYGSHRETLDGKPYDGAAFCQGGVGWVAHPGGFPIRDIWHEYNAKFTDGQLVEIVIVESNDAA